MTWGFGFLNKKDNNKKIVFHLKEGNVYCANSMIFKVSSDTVYNPNEEVGASIPYEWLVEMLAGDEICYSDSSLGLPKGYTITEATEEEIRFAESVVSKNEVSFQNVERLIIESKLTLDKAMRMLTKLRNGKKW